MANCFTSKLIDKSQFNFTSNKSLPQTPPCLVRAENLRLLQPYFMSVDYMFPSRLPSLSFTTLTEYGGNSSDSEVSDGACVNFQLKYKQVNG